MVKIRQHYLETIYEIRELNKERIPDICTVDHNNCGKFFKRWEYQTTLTCLLRNLYAGQEATVRTGHGTTDWFQIGKGVWHLRMVAAMTADPKCGTQQVIQLFHIMS